MKPKFFITTLGCKVNQYESAAISECLENSGWASACKKDTSDLYIINTCTVTQKAAMQSRQAVNQAIRSNPNAHIIVTGCYAQTEPEKLKKIKGVHLIVGHADKHRLHEMIPPPVENTPHSPVIIHRNMDGEYKFRQMPASAQGHRTRPFLKIQDGCDAFCTYCIVPYARGHSRSMPINAVIESIRKLKDRGYHEVVLSGIHLGCYGQDLSPEVSLIELLDLIRKSKAIDRVRISSVEPNELTDDIIQLVSNSKRLCHHFHIPLQSGDDSILKKMRRPYTRSFFKDLIYKIHKSIPGAAIGADVLVGFPGETDSHFENTYTLIEELPVTYLHVFPFSSRNGTPADHFSGKVSDKEIKSRCKKLRGLGHEKKKKFYQDNIGKSHEVLIESKRNVRSGLLRGFTSNYIPVLIDDTDDLKNTIAKIKIVDLKDNDTVYGISCF